MPTIYNRTCEHCNSAYKTRSNSQRYCCRSCAAIVRASNRGCPPWAPDEDEILHEYSGLLPLAAIVRKVQNFNQHQGTPIRTIKAVSNRLIVLKLSRHPTEDNISCRHLAHTLGISVRKVYDWVIKHGLKRRLTSKKRSAISLTKFRQWAAIHPELLASIDHDRLLWILQDEQLARRCSQIPSHSRSRAPIKVKRKDTGQVYPSLSHAARAIDVHYSGIAKAIEQGRKCVGIEFERVN